MGILCGQEVPANACITLYVLYPISLQDEAGKPPDTLELLVGKHSRPRDRIGKNDSIIGDFKNGDAVVCEEAVFYDGQSKSRLFELVEGVESTILTFQPL